jgi:hypothetical protein
LSDTPHSRAGLIRPCDRFGTFRTLVQILRHAIERALLDLQLYLTSRCGLCQLTTPPRDIRRKIRALKPVISSDHGIARNSFTQTLSDLTRA